MTECNVDEESISDDEDIVSPTNATNRRKINNSTYLNNVSSIDLRSPPIDHVKVYKKSRSYDENTAGGDNDDCEIEEMDI